MADETHPYRLDLPEDAHRGEAMRTYYATFGVKYGPEPHPTLPGITGDHVIQVEAPDGSTARTLIHALTGGAYAFLYEEIPGGDRYTYQVYGTLSFAVHEYAVGDPDPTPELGTCGDMSAEQFSCTWNKGHPGPHVAGTGVRIAAVWS